jgi:hypothetical protein
VVSGEEDGPQRLRGLRDSEEERDGQRKEEFPPFRKKRVRVGHRVGLSGARFLFLFFRRPGLAAPALEGGSQWALAPEERLL